jgi:hypothetical protein
MEIIMSTVKISVYLENGLVYSYTVNSPSSAREHAYEIVQTGYRHTTPTGLTHYPPHKIKKVKCEIDPATIQEGEPDDVFTTGYSDTVRGT